MKTPAGFECKFFYGDYYRGRNRQECRLIAQNRNSEPWTPGLCRDCAVPRIITANACPHLVLEARVVKTALGLGRKVGVRASCLKTLQDVAKPAVGCGHCHEEIGRLASKP